MVKNVRVRVKFEKIEVIINFQEIDLKLVNNQPKYNNPSYINFSWYPYRCILLGSNYLTYLQHSPFLFSLCYIGDSQHL